jgi:cobalt-zinc-cadmium efflux system outer membrane protein
MSALALLLSALVAAPLGGEASARLDRDAFVRRVLEASPDLAAARAAIDAARAQIDVARAFPDPQLTAGLTQLELTRSRNPTQVGAQLSVPIELGGKRGARIAAAQAGVPAASLDAQDAARLLRAAAANAFIDALRARRVIEQKQRSLADLERLVSVNERRLAAGDAAQAAVLQSRVEAQQFRAEVHGAEGDLRAAEALLSQLLTQPVQAAELVDDLGAQGELPAGPGEAALLAALDARADVRAAEARVAQSGRQIDSEERKRVIDVSVGVSWLHGFAVSGEGGAASADFVGASLTVPLPFSRTWRGELDAALAARRQAVQQHRAARLRAEGELRQALARLQAARAQVATYERATLGDADAVLEKTLYNYQRGGASLTEVLIAQRTATAVHLAYLDALADRARAVVAVQQAAGLSREEP